MFLQKKLYDHLFFNKNNPAVQIFFVGPGNRGGGKATAFLSQPQTSRKPKSGINRKLKGRAISDPPCSLKI